MSPNFKFLNCLHRIVWRLVYDLPKHHYDVISYHYVSKLAYLVEHDIGYQPSKFQCSVMSGSNFMEGGGNPPPKCYNEIRKPSVYRVKIVLEKGHCLLESTLFSFSSPFSAIANPNPGYEGGCCQSFSFFLIGLTSTLRGREGSNSKFPLKFVIYSPNLMPWNIGDKYPKFYSWICDMTPKLGRKICEYSLWILMTGALSCRDLYWRSSTFDVPGICEAKISSLSRCPKFCLKLVARSESPHTTSQWGGILPGYWVLATF